MRRRLAAMLAVVLGAVMAIHFGTAQAQFEVPKPGPEHKVLEPLVGTWQAKIKFWLDPAKDPTETQGTMIRKWILDNRFLQEDFDGQFFGMPFKGMGITGYDPIKKKYVGSWIDSMSLHITASEGTYDAKTKTFTSMMEETDATGKKMKGRDVLRIVDDEHQMHEMYRTPEGGKEFKVMEIHYTRAKK